VYDYMRLLWARVGLPHCPNCGRVIQKQTVQQIVDAILALPAEKRIMILAPLIRDRKGEHQQIFDDARRAGFVRVRIDGEVRDLGEDIELDKNRRHTIELVIDRLVTETPAPSTDGDTPSDQRPRLADSVETALRLGAGVVLVAIEGEEERLYSEHFACVFCGISLGELAPRNFSFNSPHGACRTCTGLGVRLDLDPELVIPNKNLTLAQGAIQPWARAGTISGWYYRMVEAMADKHGFSTRVPVKDLEPEDIEKLLHSTGEHISVRYVNQAGRTSYYDTTYEGVIPNLSRRFRETESDYVRSEIERYMTASPCPDCHGDRLKPESLAVTIDDKNIIEVTKLSLFDEQRWFEHLAGPQTPLSSRDQQIAYQILKEIRARLDFLVEVGVGYLTLDRRTATLSGGEAQRIRLATQIGSGLMGVLYVCDEPTVGLHAADDARLIRTLERLRNLGNTVIVVEHDEAMMRAADHIIDMGPGAGEQGGTVVVAGTMDDLKAEPRSITGQYLSGAREIPLPPARRSGNGQTLVIEGARENNLKNINVTIPLGKFVCITGVSGSGKSTLINDILYKKAAQLLYGARDRPGDCDGITGLHNIDKVVNIDQSPIGRTPRSNPATYTGAFTPIRELFATVPEARMRGYPPGRFSFNVKGGRCEACAGEGYIQIEMNFLPDVTVPCEVCKGRRYNREALEILFRGKNIADVLDMTVDQAADFFHAFTKVRGKLETLQAVGLGYIRLGQPATTLSGGEAQRVKLSTELSRRSTGRTLYILDEPTTGLSFEDTYALLRVLHRLVDGGNTVVIIEHHLDVVKNADHIIDLGPLGGDEGGDIVVEGTPEQVAESQRGFTGRYLRPKLATPATIV
ncbi:MAG: excinuclease ABC subunit UvrA, partial [Dehalococcoidia bacterium]